MSPQQFGNFKCALLVGKSCARTFVHFVYDLLTRSLLFGDFHFCEILWKSDPSKQVLSKNFYRCLAAYRYKPFIAQVATPAF
jgi:hypothetical protein